MIIPMRYRLALALIASGLVIWVAVLTPNVPKPVVRCWLEVNETQPYGYEQICGNPELAPARPVFLRWIN